MLAIEKMTYAGIPCYEIAERDRETDVDVLLYHGWGSNATKQCFRGQLLAGFGYRVIVPEISGHGVRGTLAYEDSLSVVDFLRVWVQSIHECAQLQEAVFLANRPHFLVGHSLGGLIVLGAVAKTHSALNGVVAINSSANWSAFDRMMQYIYGGDNLVPALLKRADAQALLKELEGVNPSYWQAHNLTTPVLLTNGNLDQIMPAIMNAAFCEQWQFPHVRQVVINDAGHVVTDSALAEVVDFINKAR